MQSRQCQAGRSARPCWGCGAPLHPVRSRPCPARAAARRTAAPRQGPRRQTLAGRRSVAAHTRPVEAGRTRLSGSEAAHSPRAAAQSLSPAAAAAVQTRWSPPRRMWMAEDRVLLVEVRICGFRTLSICRCCNLLSLVLIRGDPIDAPNEKLLTRA